MDPNKIGLDLVKEELNEDLFCGLYHYLRDMLKVMLGFTRHAPAWGNVAHMDRFNAEFGMRKVEEDDENFDTGHQIDRWAVLLRNAFHSNTRRSIKLYSNFYSSDVIVASPLGLITKIAEAEVEKEKDFDYLSSIEVLVIDHADVITMQNWSHVNTVVEHMNRMPSKQHGTDVMRVKQWYLDGHARFYRQTILLGSFLTPDMNALFNRVCVNYEGKVKLISKHKGLLHKVLLQVCQVYHRFEASSVVDVDDARLEYFSKKVFPKIKDSLEGGTMIFTSSYFEFVRIRNFLKSQNASFCLLSEYTKQSDVSRSRLWFLKAEERSCFTLKELIFTTDIRFVG
ncbi:hypothetical protein HPP92_002666 [Vanilla planifolia]|uniref:U3 small nucleolar RNA-associated protein 25 n=1 Tax=Vanilla planifolia TaxID=51239 RepID=A0A835S1Y1_VANPL|nr:hypothetical protein HPP92_002666 [Vanilla planifolia]